VSALPSLSIFGDSAAAPYLTLGLSSDPVSWIALGAALLLAIAGTSRPLRARLERAPVGLVLGFLAVVACALSMAYLRHYLRGGPRIIDATSYFLEARGFAAGKIWLDVPEPRASFHGRFLLSSPQGLAVIFPPGYPAVLALGFWFGAPLAVGPLLAGALVPATYGAARAFGAGRAAAYAAAAFSVASAALRYHTADTMAHGLCALLVAALFAFAVRESKRSAAAAGVCAGLLIATRPVTGLVLLTIVAFGIRTTPRRRLIAALSAIPLVVGFLLHQRALTGEWLRSGQAAYYAVADGPPGCFRYGFGSGIGCLFEHGDFVRARLADGYGFTAAFANTLRRLLVHLSDIANAAPLALGVPLGAFFAWRERSARAGAAAILALMLAYAPFYFEGSYPGGGARFFADVLPLEHAFLAIAVAKLGVLRFAFPFSVLGFALHTSHQHEALARREGGRPMFEPGVLARRGVEHGLVFVGTDHGFALGHDPSSSDLGSGLLVARARSDALDRLLWESLGRPPSFRYRYNARADAAVPTVEPYEPRATLRVEGESLYPPQEVRDGFAHPEVRLAPCVSGRGVLKFRPTSGRPVRITLTLPPFPSPSPPSMQRAPRLAVGWADDGAPDAPKLWVRGSQLRTAWLERASGPCSRALSADLPIDLSAGPLGVPLELTLVASAGSLDYVELDPG
jgi:hypothetical protein